MKDPEETAKIYLLISFSGKRTGMETTYPPLEYPTRRLPTHPGAWNCR